MTMQQIMRQPEGYPTALELEARLDAAIMEAVAIVFPLRPAKPQPRGLVYYGNEVERCDTVAGEIG
jgi:hypothetical protein